MNPESVMDLFEANKDKIAVDSPARERLAKLFDDGSFVELDAYTKSDVVAGYGEVEGEFVLAFAQNGGAVNVAQAIKMKKIYDMASKVGAPIVGLYDSNGADVSDAQASMSAYSDILTVANNLSGVVPQIAVVCGICAGTSAIIAASADVVIMNENAELFVTAPFVSKALGDATPGAGTAENAVMAGVAHIVADDEDKAIETARKVLSILPINNLSMVPLCDFDAPSGEKNLMDICENFKDGISIENVMSNVFDMDSIVELGKGFAKCAKTSFATIGGITCGVVGVSGEICGDGSAKIARFVSLCDSFSVPVITLVDCEGFVQSSASELAGSIRDSARLAHCYAEATAPKITVVLGNAIGGAYVALCNSDLSLAWPNAVISALKPDTAVAFLWSDKLIGSSDPISDREALIEEFAVNEASPFAAAKAGCVSDVIDPSTTRSELIKAIDVLSSKRVTNLPKKHGNMPL